METRGKTERKEERGKLKEERCIVVKELDYGVMEVFLHPVVFLHHVNFFVEIFSYQNTLLFCKSYDHLNFASSSGCIERIDKHRFTFRACYLLSRWRSKYKIIKKYFPFSLYCTYTICLLENIWNKHWSFDYTVTQRDVIYQWPPSMSRIIGIENYHLRFVQERNIFRMYERNNNKFENFFRTLTL